MVEYPPGISRLDDSKLARLVPGGNGFQPEPDKYAGGLDISGAGVT